MPFPLIIHHYDFNWTYIDFYPEEKLCNLQSKEARLHYFHFTPETSYTVSFFDWLCNSTTLLILFLSIIHMSFWMVENRIIKFMHLFILRFNIWLYFENDWYWYDLHGVWFACFFFLDFCICYQLIRIICWRYYLHWREREFSWLIAFFTILDR